MEFILIDIIRYIISGVFVFNIFNNPKNFIFKNVVLPSMIYTSVLISFKLFVADKPIITSISVITIFACLILNKKKNAWNYSFTFSLYMVCLLEYSHFLIFLIVSNVWKRLGIPEVTFAQPERLFISRAIILILYAIATFLIYKFDRIDIKSVCKLSNYIVFPMFFIIALGVVIYLKYHIKYTISNEFHDILSIIFVSFIVLTLIFIFSSKKFLETIEKIQKKKTNPAIEEAKLQKDNGFAGLIFESKELNFQMKYFQHEMCTIGIDTEDKKAKQLAHCAVLLNQEESSRKINMISGIYFYTGKILGLQPKSVETNISNLLKTHWTSFNPKILKKIEQNYHGPISEENGAPPPREFLLYLVKKYREDNPINENKQVYSIQLNKSIE